MHLDSGALAGRTGKSYFSAQERGALLHAEQTNGLGVVNLGLGDAPAVIGDEHKQGVGLLFEADFDFAGIRVANDVGECFLEDAKKGGV